MGIMIIILKKKKGGIVNKRKKKKKKKKKKRNYKKNYKKKKRGNRDSAVTITKRNSKGRVNTANMMPVRERQRRNDNGSKHDAGSGKVFPSGRARVRGALGIK